MRKIAVFLILAMLLGLCGCGNFNVRSNGIGKSEHKEQAQQLLDALSDGDVQTAVAMMHPDIRTEANVGLRQIMVYLDGRKVVAMEQMRINKQSSATLEGKASLEQAGFDLELDDGTVCSISVAYLEDTAGEGFSSVQLILGVV